MPQDNVIHVDFSTKKTANLIIAKGNPINPTDIRWFTSEGEIEQPIFQSVQEEHEWEHM